MKKLGASFFILILSVGYAFFPTSKVNAQTPNTQNLIQDAVGSVGVAVYMPVSGETVDGNVVCSSEGNANAGCVREYDPNMIGVISDNPAVFFNTTGGQTPGTKAIISSGKARVLVSSQNGDIKTGDFITSSKTKGVAQKATKSGFILGSALEDYSNSDKTKTGTILVALYIRPAVLKAGAGINLFQMIKDGVEGAFESPLSALRYTVAALIVSVVFIYGFIHFGKVAKSGVESIGRNPLAANSIQMGVVMNMGVIVLLMAASVFVAYLILVI